MNNKDDVFFFLDFDIFSLQELIKEIPPKFNNVSEKINRLVLRLPDVLELLLDSFFFCFSFYLFVIEGPELLSSINFEDCRNLLRLTEEAMKSQIRFPILQVLNNILFHFFHFFFFIATSNMLIYINKSISYFAC
jgi:hypothetical protein